MLAGDDETLNPTSTAMTPPPRERRLVMDLSDRLECGLETTEWFIVYQMKEIGAKYEEM
jgi:hypothetical protein